MLRFTTVVSYLTNLPVFLILMLKDPKPHPYYVQLKIVSEPMGALHSHQDGVLLLRAEAHG